MEWAAAERGPVDERLRHGRRGLGGLGYVPRHPHAHRRDAGRLGLQRWPARGQAGRALVLGAVVPHLHAQAPHVAKLSAQYSGQVNVVGVGGLSDAADIREIGRQVEGPIHLVDEEGSIWTHFGVTAQSTFVLLDADGAVVSEGYLDNGVLSARVAELVGWRCRPRVRHWPWAPACSQHSTPAASPLRPST